jgi:hypothetical protein
MLIAWPGAFIAIHISHHYYHYFLLVVPLLSLLTAKPLNKG